MGCQNNGGMMKPVHFPDERANSSLDRNIQTDRGFVQIDNGGIVQECGGQFTAHFLTE
ncbi:hypothetical protein D3C84_1301460 [compost metagenome]